MALFRLLVPAATATALLVQPSVGYACSDDDECAASDRWTLFSAAHDVVAPDGVIVFRTERGSSGQLDDSSALQHVQVSVATTDGTEVGGQLELVEGAKLVVFRPDAPLPTGTELTATVIIDNAGIDDEELCDVGPQAPFTFTVSADPLPGLALPALEIQESHEIIELPTLETLVCCDGAYPETFSSGCPGPGWIEGFCAAEHGVGLVRAELSLSTLELDPQAQANFMIRLVAGDATTSSLANPGATLSLSDDEVLSIHYEIINLASGELLTSDPVTVGEAVADQLGELELDVEAALAATCVGEPYVCDVTEDEAWDPDACTAWRESARPGETEGNTEGGTDTEGTDDSEGGSGSGSSEGSAGQDEPVSGCSCSVESSGGQSLGFLSLLVMATLRSRGRQGRRA